MPIGSEAVYETVTSPLWTTEALRYGLLINSDNYSMPIYVARSSDPLRKIYRTDGGPSGYVVFEQRVPDSARPDPGGDAHLHLIDETHSFVIEMIQAVRRPDGDLQAPFPNSIDLKGSGVFDRYHGSCAYGGSCMAGVIRPGELENGIRHALRISITTQVLNRVPPEGRSGPHVWPANTADGDWASSYQGTGNVYIGTLLAIPPEVDLETIAGPAGTPAFELARALQDYGAYVVDRGHLNLYAEPSAKEEVDAIPWAQRQEIPKYLQVVANNSEQHPGGGGTPRRPLAPPFE
jgi:hypothetical protein